MRRNQVLFGRDQFYEMTPKRILIIADAIKGTCAVAGGYSLISNNVFLSAISLGLVIACELIQRLFGVKK